jgi:UTP-glucose-1-phosphate uridylyltransferase
MASLTLAVMAAGIGRRYGGLKQVTPVGPSGETLVEYAIYDALRAGFARVVFIVREETLQTFRETVGARVEQQVETSYANQTIDILPAPFSAPPDRNKPWGTAHAVLSCRDVIDSPFAVINADDFYGGEAFTVLGDYLLGAAKADGIPSYCMVGYALENTLPARGVVARGICSVDTNGYLVEIVERTRVARFGSAAKYTVDGDKWIPLPADSITSINLWGFTPRLFPALQAGFRDFLEANANRLETAEYYLPDAVGGLIAQNRAEVRVLTTSEKWRGMTYREDKSTVEQAIQRLVNEGQYPRDLWGGAA